MGLQYKKTAVAACLIMSAMIAGSVCFGFFMDPVTTDMGFGRGAFSLYFSLVTIVGTITLPIYGRIIGKVGARKLVIAGGIWTGLAMAAFSLCQNLVMFYVVACLVGLGFYGCSYIAAPVIVDTWFKKKNGSIMGAAAACGGLVGVVLGIVFPQIITALGWRMGYVCMGAMVTLLTVPAGIFLLHSRPQDVGLEPYGADEAAQDELGAPDQDAAPAEATGMTRAEALKSPQLWLCIAAFVIFAGTVSITQHLAAYFVSIGFDAAAAGIFMSIISAGIIVTNVAAGALADRAGLLRTLVIVSVLYAASFGLLPVAGVVFVPICVALVLMSLGNAYTTLLAPMSVSAVFGTREYASIWGIVSMACVLGQAIGTPIWGLSFDLTGGYQAGMFASVALNLAAMAFLIVALRKRAR